MQGIPPPTSNQVDLGMFFCSASVSRFSPAARPQPRCGSHKQCSDGRNMRPSRSCGTNVHRQSGGLPTMRGMTRIKIGGHNAQPAGRRTGELENCSTATASTRPTMADCSFAFADPRFPMLIKVCQRGWKYWKLTQMIINLPSSFSPTPNISTDIGNKGTL